MEPGGAEKGMLRLSNHISKYTLGTTCLFSLYYYNHTWYALDGQQNLLLFPASKAMSLFAVFYYLFPLLCTTVRVHMLGKRAERKRERERPLSV